MAALVNIVVESILRLGQNEKVRRAFRVAAFKLNSFGGGQGTPEGSRKEKEEEAKK